MSQKEKPKRWWEREKLPSILSDSTFGFLDFFALLSVMKADIYTEQFEVVDAEVEKERLRRANPNYTMFQPRPRIEDSEVIDCNRVVPKILILYSYIFNHEFMSFDIRKSISRDRRLEEEKRTGKKMGFWASLWHTEKIDPSIGYWDEFLAIRSMFKEIDEETEKAQAKWKKEVKEMVDKKITRMENPSWKWAWIWKVAQPTQLTPDMINASGPESCFRRSFLWDQDCTRIMASNRLADGSGAVVKGKSSCFRVSYFWNQQCRGTRQIMLTSGRTIQI